MDPESHSRAQELFEKTEALPPEERATFLDSIYSEDPTLYREVTSLLDAAEGMAEDFLEPPRAARVERIRVGETLAHYRILKPLGAGGMGEVYLAEDERLKRQVALKVLPPDFARSPERLQRFQREAEALAALNHPNVITIYSIENIGGLHFLTMELVEGRSLRELLDQSGALPIEDVLDLGVQIAEGLAEAHAAGIAHRDLKPANVMIAANDRVKVLDFGLAGPVRVFGVDAGRADPKAQLTKEGAIMGTISYMSPEQLMGRPVDYRSDIFSLGILLFELATGRHPFPSKTETSVLAKILEREPEALLEARPGLPKELGRIVGRCLEKDRTKRYQDTAQLVRELKGLRRAEGSGSSAADEQPRGWSFHRSSRRSVLTAAAALAVALGVLGIWRWTRTLEPPPARDPPSVAVLPLRNISEEPEDSNYLAQGIGQAVTTRLTQAGLRVAPWESVQRVDVDLPLKQVAEELGVETILVGTFQLVDERIRTSLALVEAANGLQKWADSFDEPFDDLFAIQRLIALRAAESLKGQLTPEEQKTLIAPESGDLYAYDLYLQGAHLLQAQDEESTRVALRYFQQALENDPELVEAHVGLGAAYSMRYFNSWSGVDDLRVAEESYLAALRLDPASMRARRGLIRIEAERGRSEEVLIHAREARRVGRPNDVDTLLAEAEGFILGGLVEFSLPIFRKVLELDPLNEAASWWLVLAAAWTGEFEAGVRAGEAYSSRFGDDAQVHTWVGVSHYALGRLGPAEEHYRQATTGRRQDLASLFSLLFRGHLQQESGRQDEALSTWKTGLEAVRSRRELVADSPRLLMLGAAFETCLYDAPSREALRETLDRNMANGLEVGLLAAAFAKQGSWQRSAELLRWALDRGGIYPAWRGFFRGLGVDPDSPRLAEFLQALEARELELEERFGPRDPPEGVSARQ